MEIKCIHGHTCVILTPVYNVHAAKTTFSLILTSVQVTASLTVYLETPPSVSHCPIH